LLSASAKWYKKNKTNQIDKLYVQTNKTW